MHGINAHVAWSPNGDRLLFCSSRTGFKDEALLVGAPQPYGEVFVMRYDGAEVQRLTDDQWEEGGTGLATSHSPDWENHSIEVSSLLAYIGRSLAFPALD